MGNPFANIPSAAMRKSILHMKYISLITIVLLFAAGCGKPIIFTNDRYKEFPSSSDIKAKSLHEYGFRVDNLDAYLPLLASASNICVCEESGIDMTLWWSFNLSPEDFQQVEKIAMGSDPCPYTPNTHKTFWIPADKVIKGVHSRENMTWIGIDPVLRRVYCVKYTT